MNKSWQNASIPPAVNTAWFCQVPTSSQALTLFVAIGLRACDQERPGWIGQASLRAAGYKGQIEIIEFLDLQTADREKAQKRILQRALQRAKEMLT